ncbi:MAG: metal-sensitive transcriptional regulator [Limnochordaceae bacterium]|nr:metal-sensitive transcriptional regulator [Limnochordaceae bacterium]
MGYLAGQDKRQVTAQKVVRRLKVADGHLQGIIRMVESGVECHAVFNQLIAVKSGLEKAALYLLACYGEEAITEGSSASTQTHGLDTGEGEDGRGNDRSINGNHSTGGDGGGVRQVVDEILAMAAQLLG